MIVSYLKREIKNEMAVIIDRHTTSRKQLTRIQSLLKDIRKLINSRECRFSQDLHPFPSDYRNIESISHVYLLRDEELRIEDKIRDEHRKQRSANRGSIANTYHGEPVIRTPFRRRKRRSLAGQFSDALHQRQARLDDLERESGFQMRFVTAILGGLALIAPMLIMAIHPIREKTLITASLAVFLFALGLAWKSSAKRQEILAVTAAYAAVMVVFVGI